MSTSTQTIKMKDFPKEERPREKFIEMGGQQVSNQELLAILIGSGTKKESALDLSNRILMHFDGLKLLRDATIEEITAIKGIGVAKGVTVLAAIELGRRLQELKPEERFTIKSPADGADYVMEEMRHLNQEHLVAMYLNTKNQIIHRQTIFIGSLNASIVHPREIFREAVRRSAASVICAHNHPSGDPTPSQEDIHVTRRLVEAGKVMGIQLLDHIIIGDKSFISLKEKGYI